MARAIIIADIDDVRRMWEVRIMPDGYFECITWDGRVFLSGSIQHSFIKKAFDGVLETIWKEIKERIYELIDTTVKEGC